MSPKLHVLFLVFLICSEELMLISCKRSRRKKNAAESNKTNSRATKIFHPNKSKWPSPRININWKSIYVLTKKPTNRVMCKIFCRSGYHVQILSSGIVRGTVNQSSKYSKSIVCFTDVIRFYIFRSPLHFSRVLISPRVRVFYFFTKDLMRRLNRHLKPVKAWLFQIHGKSH